MLFLFVDDVVELILQRESDSLTKTKHLEYIIIICTKCEFCPVL